VPGRDYTVNVAARGMARLNLKMGADLPLQALTGLGRDFTGAMVVRRSSGLSIVGANYLYWAEDDVIAYNWRLAAYAGFLSGTNPRCKGSGAIPPTYRCRVYLQANAPSLGVSYRNR